MFAVKMVFLVFLLSTGVGFIQIHPISALLVCLKLDVAGNVRQFWLVFGLKILGLGYTFTGKFL